jgi:iron complex outermembrane receptor protein
MRYTHQQKNYTYERNNPPSVGGGPDLFFGPGFNNTVGKFSGGKTDYRTNLEYRWNPDLMTYASVSTGFKGGGTNPRPFNPAQVQAFGPESLTAYEIGAKTDWFDHTLRLNLSGFYNKYKEIQQVVLLSCPQFGGPGPCAAPVNGGNANVYGAELEAEYRFGGLSIDGAVSYQHFKYTSIDPLSGIALGSVEPRFQPDKWSLGAQ